MSLKDRIAMFNKPKVDATPSPPAKPLVSSKVPLPTGTLSPTQEGSSLLRANSSTGSVPVSSPEPQVEPNESSSETLKAVSVRDRIQSMKIAGNAPASPQVVPPSSTGTGSARPASSAKPQSPSPAMTQPQFPPTPPQVSLHNQDITTTPSSGDAVASAPASTEPHERRKSVKDLRSMMMNIGPFSPEKAAGIVGGIKLGSPPPAPVDHSSAPAASSGTVTGSPESTSNGALSHPSMSRPVSIVAKKRPTSQRQRFEPTEDLTAP